jgi:hypothetical protein
MQIGKYNLTQQDVIVWIIFIVASVAALGFIIFSVINMDVVAGSDILSNVANACINIASFFLAAIFAIFAILITRDAKIPGKFLYAAIIPIIAIITGLFALISSYFPKTAPLAIVLLGVSLEFTIITLIWIFLLINMLTSKNTIEFTSKDKN